MYLFLLGNSGVDLAVNDTFVVFCDVEKWQIVRGHLGKEGAVFG